MTDIGIHKLDIYLLHFADESKFCWIRTELLNVIHILPSFRYYTLDAKIISNASILQ